MTSAQSCGASTLVTSTKTEGRAAEFSTKNLQLATFLHASELLSFLRTETDDAHQGKLKFVFRDEDGIGPRLQLDFNRGAAVSARNLFASQTFLRQQISSKTQKLKIGESVDGSSQHHPRS
jgi:hypothetical protein